MNVIYIGGPTIIIEVDGMRLITDPTLDPICTKYLGDENPSYYKHLRR